MSESEIFPQEDAALFEQVNLRGVEIFRIDYKELSNENFYKKIGTVMGLENIRDEYEWISFIDDMITKSNICCGIVIFISNSHLAFKKMDKNIFDLMEGFLIQVKHWIKSEKPCHLCFELFDRE